MHRVLNEIDIKTDKGESFLFINNHRKNIVTVIFPRFALTVKYLGRKSAWITRTTNACEMLHRNFNGFVYIAHPNLFV